MNTPSQHANRHPFLRKIESVALFELSDAERAALEALPMQLAQIEAYQDIVREGDRPGRSFTLISGIASTYKTTRAGKRQVMSYHVPGDVPDFQSLHLQTLDISIATVSPCRVGFVQHDAVRALLRAQPRLSEVFWRATLIDAAVVREWMLNTGRREAYARMAHLFCELVMRLGAVGLAPELSCELPMTQPELADALGITPVHVNRTIRDLKAAGLIALRSRRLTVLDWDGLVSAAEFDPTYLHLRR
ncbi:MULTISPECIES: Crp/Fnr family transcriptional regulator [unclassified Methylobacterium]|jgi:CRP-like cAMP-binding protein|uniref:Crp/Fnr family transcriptional regulator n=1 Tax=unclassified Methylobacterium TaxID=2615210 RepID=UPI001352D13E|nr:Crp/Fnr family transcriptional regulator [Methylobacterium sp. 2A]MWV21692.1 Crp/Fnr family transcriptional regulator [Methylobacterium sp. 2A]